MMEKFDTAAMADFIKQEFAPMIQQLNIAPQSISETGARFRVPENSFMVRGGDLICGQAIASIADTVGVLTLFAHNSPYRLMTTVDMTTHFMRPLFAGDLQVETRILSNGRRMATVLVEVRQHGTEKVAAVSTCAYAYVEKKS